MTYADDAFASPPQPKKGKVLLILGGVFLLLAALSLAALIFGAWRSIESVSAFQQFTPPEVATYDAEAGEGVMIWGVDGTAPTLPDVLVAGPDGASVPVETAQVDANLDLNGTRYDLLATFEAAADGTHEVSAAGAGAGQTLAVGGNVGDMTAGGLSFLGGACGTVLFGLPGLILMIIGLVQRFSK